jgi:methionyl-tRNA formyltransferase
MTGAARIAFAGTPEFAVPTLSMLAREGFAIPLVLTQPDRPAGRGRRRTPSAVKRRALELGLQVEQPERMDTMAQLAGWGAAPDLLVVVAYGLLLPQWLLDWPRAGCLNLHASLLPRWRGAAPVQRAILAGDQETGVSLMQLVRKLDAGPVYARQSVPVRGTAASLQAELAAIGAELLAEMLPGILSGSRAAIAQDGAAASYARKLVKAEAALDWHRPAVEIERAVRGFNPWPVAEGRLDDGRRLRIWEAGQVAGEAQAAPGSIIATDSGGIVVATGRGLIELRRIQPPGSRAMTTAEFLAAHSVAGHSFVGT